MKAQSKTAFSSENDFLETVLVDVGSLHHVIHRCRSVQKAADVRSYLLDQLWAVKANLMCSIGGRRIQNDAMLDGLERDRLVCKIRMLPSDIMVVFGLHEPEESLSQPKGGSGTRAFFALEYPKWRCIISTPPVQEPLEGPSLTSM